MSIRLGNVALTQAKTLTNKRLKAKYPNYHARDQTLILTSLERFHMKNKLKYVMTKIIKENGIY